MVKQNGKSNSSKKSVSGSGGVSLLNEKGQSKSNPWNEDQILAGMDANLQHSSAQAVQSLPGVLADDAILAAILKPRLSGPIKLGQLENVTPLKVSYGGASTEQPASSANSSLVKQKVHKNQQVEYDRSKGFVSTSWANFLMDPDKAKESPLTTQKEGLFIRHVTSTVLNPNDLLKGGKGGGGGGAPPSVNVESLSYTSGSLLSNTWTNVLMYTPKEQVFKMDMATGKYKPEGSAKKKPHSARPTAAASSTSASSTSTSTSMKNEPSKSVTAGFSRSTSAASIKKEPSKSVKVGSSARPSSARSVKKEPSKSVKAGSSARPSSARLVKKEPSKSVKVGPAASASASAGKKETSKSAKGGANPKVVAKKKK